MSDLSALSKTLGDVFSSTSPTFLSDSTEVVGRLVESGIEAYVFNDVPRVSTSRLANVVMIPVDFATTPTGSFIEGYFSDSAMLVIPVASFCQTPRGALYFLELLAQTDLGRCIDGNLRWLDYLETATDLHLTGNGTDVRLTLADELYLMSPKTTLPIAPGEWVSIAQYLEVGLVGHANGAKPYHTLNGTFSADGVVVASHRYAQTGVLDLVHEAWDFLGAVRNRNEGAPILVEIVDSRPLTIRCGDEDITTAARNFTDPNQRTYVTEFAFAADSQWDETKVDWTVNSQLNEAIGGIHMGLGAGLTGVHIDLVAPQATIAR